MTTINHGFTVRCDSCEWERHFDSFDGDFTRNGPSDFGEFSGDDEEIFTCEECLKKSGRVWTKEEIEEAERDAEKIGEEIGWK